MMLNYVFYYILLYLIKEYLTELNMWYLDDGTIGGPAELVAADLAALATSLPHIGLEIPKTVCSSFTY